MAEEKDINLIVELIDKRFNEVVDANGIEKDENNFQYTWIKGIYNDLSEYLKIALK
jgi:hypothetical protein